MSHVKKQIQLINLRARKEGGRGKKEKKKQRKCVNPVEGRKRDGVVKTHEEYHRIRSKYISHSKYKQIQLTHYRIFNWET